MRLHALAIVAVAASASAQKVIGTAYGFGAGATGGGNAAVVTPSTAEELAKYLSDDVARTILINKTFDFTGKTSTGAGCDKTTCRAATGGQLYLGQLSCGDYEKTAVSSITYDTAGTSPLLVGSNKSILGLNGKGVLKGKGLQVKKGASNVIIQGIELTTINPGIVWGGDGLDLQGGNSKIWVDHCKFSLVGRMFVVSHYEGSSVTLSNNVFDGVTTQSATCNNNHYWGVMFIGKNEQITLDKNHFHDLSGRAPKLGQDGVTGYYHAINNLFENMKGHAFDAYNGANALVEGNAFEAVSQPSTVKATSIKTFVSNGGSACASALGRNCLTNSIDAFSGKLGGGSSTSFISHLANVKVHSELDAKEVAAYVKANAGPSKLNSGSEQPVVSVTSTTTKAIRSTTSTKTSTTHQATVTAITRTSLRTSATTKATLHTLPSGTPVKVTSTATKSTTKSAVITSAAIQSSFTTRAASSKSTQAITTSLAMTGYPTLPTTTAQGATQSSNPTPSASPCPAKLYYQCGGRGFKGPKSCEAPATCVEMNEWYSQCINNSSKFRRALARA